MLKWLSGEEGEPGSVGPGSPRAAAAAAVAAGGGGGGVAVEEMAERLTQTELLVTQLKEIIREKDAALRSKDDQLKVEKETCDAKLSKLRLQNKAKVTSLNAQLEELKKQQGGQGTPTHSKKGSSEGGGEHASRGKIVLLKKKVEELEQQLAQRQEELELKRKEVESQRQRGEEMDAMLTERDRKLVEKEAYIVHLQTALAGDQPITPAPQQQVAEDSGAMQELQLLVQSLTRKVGEAEERYSLLKEQTDSLKELLATEKEQYVQKENMYKQNIQTFKDIIIQKDNQLMEISQMHEQELFKLAAKSDASADLEQLLKALKQKLHEKEEVLLGKTQVIDVLQGEVDGRDQQIKELAERLRRLHVERESLESKMEAEKHVMRAQLRDLMEKQQAEVRRVTEQHQAQMAQTQQDLLGQLEELRRTSRTAEPAPSQEASGGGGMSADPTSIQRIAELEAQAKQKTDEASRSEAKFLKMKAWSKSRIRQLEEELKRSQAGSAPPDLTALRSRVTALEEEREENLWKVEQYEELKANNEMLVAKLVVYEEQQRTLQADLEQFTKRAASQASESGSADDTQSHVLEWQEMVAEAVSARDRAKEEKVAMALRISHMEEEREELIEDDWFFPGCSDPALATRQQELEEELTQARGLGPHRAKKLAAPAQRSLQEDFEFDGQASFQDPRSASESTTPMEGENMGGWWPEYSTPDTDGLRSVVEELELERNQLQEQILSLEERCQDLEDRLQLQARIEALQVTFDVDEDEQPFWVSQNESERLQIQLAGVRSQQSRDAEKHQLLVSSLNEQLKGLSNTQECLESSLIEKENTLAKTSEKLELINGLRESLSEKEVQLKDVSDKLLQAEHALESVSRKCSSSEKQRSEMKTEVVDLAQKLSVLKEKTQKQEVTVETLQTELDQTNEELDKLNSTHLEERAQLIHDLQSCEREIDRLRDVVLEKDEEISTLSGNMAEYAEQVTALKREVKLKEENLVRVETALSKAEREATIIRESQTSDQRELDGKISELVEKVKDTEVELVKAKEERESNVAEVEHLIKQAEEDKRTIQELRGEIQKQIVSQRNHLSECETHITSLKEQLTLSKDKNTSSEQLLQRELKSVKDEQNELLAQVEKHNNEMQTLSRQLEEQVQSEEHIKKDMQEKLETITSLENQLKTTGERAEDERRKFNTELQNRDSEKEKLSDELQSKSENISKLKNLLKSVKTEKKQLQEKLKGLTEELELQKQNVNQLGEKVSSAVELNRSLENQVDVLIKERERLELEVAESVETISRVTLEKDSLQAQVSVLETQRSQNNTIIEGLEKDKEDLTLRTNELNRVFEQSANSSSETLLAKTNECSELSRLLREREEKVKQLQEEVQNLSSQVEQLQRDQTQLQETLSLRREQERSLTSGLTEKDAMLKEKQDGYHSLQNEFTLQKSIVSKLQTEAESLGEEHSQLRRQIEEREEMLKNVTQQCEKHKDELNDANNAVKSLSDRIRVAESEAELRRTEVASLNGHIQAATEENHRLRSACESREKELALQKQVLSDLDGRLKATLEENAGFSVQISNLTENNRRLQEEQEQNIRSVSELTAERNLLREQKSGLEIQISENQNTIDGLSKEKEKLAAAGDELKQDKESNSAGLLEKTSECAHLSEQLDGLKKQVGQLDTSLKEKEQTSSAQQNQLLQLQDTVSMLQEQGSVLKTGLLEKDAMFQQKAAEVEQQKALVSQTQAEVEQKEQTLKEVIREFQKHKEELDKRNESVISLSGQLGAMNENAAEAEAEIANLKAAVQKLTAENSQLTQTEDQRRADVVDFNDNIQALTEQNARLKSELQRTATELSKAHEEVAHLKTAVSDWDDKLQTAASEKERLRLSVKGQDESLKQQESLIRQLNGRISEQEEQLKQKADDNDRLSAKVSELEDCVCKLRGQVDRLSSESSALKDSFEIKEKSSLEYQSHSSAAVENLSSDLRAKEVECDSLKEKTSHLEESVTKLNVALQVQISEVENLRKALEEKESKSLQDIQRRADEASLFKTQFAESTELVSQLQSRIQLLSAESENLKTSAGETQRAFNDLQERYATSLEELRDARKQLSQRTDEASGLRKSLNDTGNEHQTTIETLRRELSAMRRKLEKTEDLNLNLSKEKDEAFASHQASVSLLTVEIERLKSQHLQVVAQMNALTENLEQREMALHAINSQYTSQAKHTSQLLSEIQKLEQQNKRLNEEISSSKEEHQKRLAASGSKNARLQEEVRKHVAEREELEKRHHQIRASQVQMEQRSGSTKEIMEQTTSEKESLQAKVSAKDEEVSRLTENIQKIEQILQDSEREWLLVLDREKQDKNLLAEQLQSVENEMKSKDVKVNALKGDLDRLQEKLAVASSAIRQGSDQLSAKESEASASRIQLEKVLASVQEKENDNNHLQQALNAAEHQLQTVLERKNKESSVENASLQDLIKQLQDGHQSEVDTLKNELDKTVAQLHKTQTKGERSDEEKGQQIALLQEMVERLQTELETAKEAAVKHASLQGESQAKDEQINCMSIQISQQKELMAGLGQQLWDKDASVAQVIESASNERMKLAAQLENVEQEHKTSTERLGEISQQLEERISSSQREIETKNSETLELMNKNKDLKSELAAVCKEKDATKKKLQAALVVRKDLLKRIEQYENANDKSEVSLLQDTLQEVTNRAQASAQIYEENVSLLEKKILEHKTESERLVEQLESEKQVLLDALDEKEACLVEKSSLVERLQSVAAQKEDALEQDRKSSAQKLEELQNELKDKSSSAAAAVDLENELAQMKLEKAKIQKKAQAALLARKETLKKAQENEKKLTQELAELKDDYKALLEQRCQQTNELNAVQMNFDEKVRELEEIRKSSLSDLDELDTLRQLVEERDKTLQDLKMSLAEKESQCHSLSNLQMELENVKSRFESASLEMASKDKALVVAEALKAKLHAVEDDLKRARAEVKEKTEEVEKHLEEIKAAELKSRQEKQVLLTQLSVSESEKHQLLMEENEALLEKSNQMKVELETAVASILTIQKTSAETQQQLSDDKRALTEELEQTQLRLDSLKQEKEDAFRLMDGLRDEVATLKEKVKEIKCAENFEVKLKERDDALVVCQALVSEKEELIAALELQLKQQIRTHETAVEKMRTEADELQKSTNDQDNQSKITLLTRKLQAALVSRKELLKENATLKEEVEKLSAKHETKEAEYFNLESSVLKLRQQNVDLESSVSSLNKEKDELSTEADGIFSDNRSLSAACDSLKLTIENITQQKQAFSCQLESLNDSQAEELSKWKTKHAELKQEYESLLQAYENVSSEMDKMRQLLEGSKRDRQEALRKTHKQEAEMEILDKRAKETEEENARIKERMHKFSKEKRQKIEELEEENEKMKKELAELEENHKMAVCDLTDRHQQLEAELCRLKETSEELREKLAELEAENNQLTEKLEEASGSLEEKHLESKTYTNNMQLKLDEALSLNNSLTAQIEAQKTELGAQSEINNVLQKEKQNLSGRIEEIQNDHELQLGKKDDDIKELKDVIDGHNRETISLNEKVRILEDDKSLLQEELENAQEISDKVKNENEYLETVILKNSERIDELTESVSVWQTQSAQLSSQLAASKEMSGRVRQEKEEEQLKLVREFEEKLKTVQRGSEGSKNVKKELRELLREKHQEINQLQQNCIKYQEVILDLESALKSSRSAGEHSEKELKKSSEKMSALEERGKGVEAELTTHKNLLQQASERIQSVESERDQLALDLSQERKTVLEETKSPQNTDEKQFYLENQFMLQQQIDELKELKDKESQKVTELRQHLDSQDLQINTLKRSAVTNEAKLSALCGAPQGADASKLWNDLYQKTLHEKDSQLLEQGFVIKRFLEDMRAKDKEVNELRVTKSRLERTLNEYSVAAAAQQRQLFIMSASNAELSETVELMAVQEKELGAHAKRLEQDKDALNRQLADRDDLISQMQLNLQQTEKMNADADAQLLLLQSQNDRVQADFEKQEGMSLQLKTLLQSKDAEISSLLSCRDGQMSGYLEQLQANYRSQVAVYEDRLTSSRYQREKADKELRGLEAKVKSLQIKVDRSTQEKEHMAAKMESFKNSMVSLQSERERLMSEYRILEAKSQLGLKSKEADGEGGTTKGLKHEIRKLLHQMDDLNSENAMLRAQLVRYREDLNQVLFLKDNQLKVLLNKQQDVIKTLEKQKAAAEKQHRKSRSELQEEEEASDTLRADISKLKAQVSGLEALKKERSATNEGKVISDLQEAVAVKAAECNDLHQRLLSQKTLTEELKEKMQLVENETDKNLAEAEDKYNSELDTFEREVELMRNEREAADQRAAELAKDLLEMEQQLSDAKTQSKDTKAQNESMCRAMAALQNDRDQLIEDFKILRNRYDEELRETQAALNKVERSLQDAIADLAMFAKERDVLVGKLKALENEDAHAELNKLLDVLSKDLSEKERELKRVVLENSMYGRQLSAFSRSMASLQNDRDRLMDELAGAKRVVVESRQGSSPEAVTSVSVERSKGSGVGALQSENEGLEAKRQKTDELQQTVKKMQTDGLSSFQQETADLRSDAERTDALPVKQTVVLEEAVSRLEAERIQLHGDLQRCLYEIQQRDQYIQQLNLKLQQAVEEKGAVAAQLRAVSQTLRDTQNRCHWLENQVQVQGSVYAEVAPGAPQERSNDSTVAETAEASLLRERLLELEQSLTDERGRRETAEEALRLSEDRAKSVGAGLSRDAQRDFSVDMETEEEWEALSLNPNQPLITRKVKGGVAAWRRWLRGRSLYFSRLLTSRARSRYLFLAYLLTIHVLVLMCLSGAL
ncbi:uncharacterized protein LOC141781492 isoform X3 [Sebastes fasciatus]|uniref:uncharacterized protein LOC141781492 isoform X3 n=1 Tax=Sebastes fasciatus TaxID=394691 RepID=UPI003D9E2896